MKKLTFTYFEEQHSIVRDKVLVYKNINKNLKNILNVSFLCLTGTNTARSYSIKLLSKPTAGTMEAYSQLKKEYEAILLKQKYVICFSYVKNNTLYIWNLSTFHKRSLYNIIKPDNWKGVVKFL